MVDEGKHAEIATALDGIYRSTNILSPFEVKAVHKAFVKGDESATKVLGTTLAFVNSPGMPTFKAMAEAVRAWSPVIITGLMPARRHCSTARRASSRGGSIMPTMPTKVRPSSMLAALMSLGSSSIYL